MKKCIVGVLISLLVISGLVSGEEQREKYDFQGRQIGISFRFDDLTPFGERGDYSFLNPDSRLSAHIQAVEEMFNVKIRFIRHPGDAFVMSNWAPRIVSGEMGVSVFELDTRWAATNLYPLSMEGFIVPLDDILDNQYYESLPEPFRRTSDMEVNGKIYGFEVQNALLEPIVILWNTGLFEREGLPNLYELYQSGEWDYDAFVSIALQATRDTTGDGEVDQFGLNITWARNHQIGNFIYTNGAQFTNDNDGRVTVAFDTPSAIEAFEVMQKLFLEGAAVTQGLNADGRAAMIIGSPHILQRPPFLNITDTYSMVPLPKGPDSADHVYPYWNRWMAAIPVSEPEPRAVIEVVNALRKLTTPYMDVSLEQWEVDFWEKWSLALSDRVSLQLWQEAAADPVYTNNRSLVMEHGLEQAINAILAGENVATVIPSIVPEVQAILDEVFN